MKRVTVYNWRLKAETHGGAVYRTRHKMTEEAAKARDPDAVRCEGTGEVIEVAETPDEIYARAPTTRHLRGHDGKKGDE